MSEAETSFWSLLHIQTNTQIDSLTYTQTALLVATFDSDEIKSWAAWYEGQPKWRLLTDHLGVLKITKKSKLFKAQPAPSSDVEMDFDIGDKNALTGSGVTTGAKSGSKESENSVTIEMPEAGIDGRMAKRFKKRYRGFLQAGGESFEVTTADVSITGLRLEKSLPLSVGGNVAVTLLNKKGESIDLICSVINDSKNNRLKIVRTAKLDTLQKWLMDPNS